MNMRSSRWMLTFAEPFTLSGYPEELPAGEYELLMEEELLQGLSFPAYRRTGAYLTFRGKGNFAGRMELRPITEQDLEMAMAHVQDLTDNQHGDAAPSPQKDMK